MKIDGATRLFAIIGDPIKQAKTPALFNPLMEKAGVNAVLVPFHVRERDFDVSMKAIMGLGNLDGLVLTYPFKEKSLALVDDLSQRARQIGGLNAMRRGSDGRWTGDMFDGIGLLRAVAARTGIAGAKVLLIGAGGAGRAIAFAFAEAGVSSITISDLDRERTGDLAERIQRAHPSCKTRTGSAIAEGHDILVNATPIGMKAEDGLPGEIGPLSPSMTVVDIVPAPHRTPLLQKATEAGAKPIAGSAMTEGQASAILEFFGIGTEVSR
ncbi:MAG: shikimate dehydrogenase family protein [Rhizobiaceae bacterium]